MLDLLDAAADDFSESLKTSVNLCVNGNAGSTKQETSEGGISEASLERSVKTPVRYACPCGKFINSGNRLQLHVSIAGLAFTT